MKPQLDKRNLTYGDLTTKAYSSDTIRSLEEPFLEDGVPLMKMAAGSVAALARIILDHADIDPSTARIVLLAGAGNNGGDGLYAVADLARRGADVTVIATGRCLHAQGLDALLRSGGVVMALDPLASIPSCDLPDGPGQTADSLSQAVELCQDADLIIDAMTGIGSHGPLRGIPAALAEELGQNGSLPSRPAYSDSRQRDTPLVLAVDVPSGLDVDHGTLPGAYIPADLTVTMGALKPCLMLPPAAYVCGRTVLVDFGFDTSSLAPEVECMTAENCAGFIRAPRIDDTKYSRGVVGLVTGSDQYHGAGLLSARAAANANVGMIRYQGPDSVGDLILASIPEAVLGSGRVESWVLGSGVPTAEALEENVTHEGSHRLINLEKSSGSSDMPQDRQRAMIESILNKQEQNDEDGTGSSGPAIVVDAGALDLIPDRLGPEVVLTPHAGEMASLLQARGENVDTDQVLAQPLFWAIRAWELTGATILLKGAVTLVVGDDGTGQARVMTSGFGPAWLSTAGSGDVLSGTLGAVLAQNADLLEDDPNLAVDLVAAGAYLHGLAGSLASSSLQSGWEEPLVFQPRQPQVFVDQISEDYLNMSDSDYGPQGHPIRASQVAGNIPRAIGLLLSDMLEPDMNAEEGEQGRDVSLFFEHSSLWF